MQAYPIEYGENAYQDSHLVYYCINIYALMECQRWRAPLDNSFPNVTWWTQYGRLLVKPDANIKLAAISSLLVSGKSLSESYREMWTLKFMVGIL